MKVFVGIGSNLGDRLAHFEAAGRLLQKAVKVNRAAPLYQTAALMPPGAPASWNKAYLNSVIEIETEASPPELLALLKKIEREVGRTPAEVWAPRILDLDLLTWGDETFESPELQIPHRGLWERSFVLDPLKDLAPHLTLPGSNKKIFCRAREVKGHAPLWMGILNLTPDSFSDGGRFTSAADFEKRLDVFDQARIPIWDLGAESTRPGATPLSSEEEWTRLEAPLTQAAQRKRARLFHPWISVDTRHAKTATRALAAGADWINDVSGLQDPALIECLQSFPEAQLVLMHSLSVPANPRLVLAPDQDLVLFLKQWCFEKLEQLDRMGIDSSRILFDPGLGFGKTPAQSLEILRRITELTELPVRLLVGHSRKSFLTSWTSEPPPGRDGHGIGVSLKLALAGVEVLRVHEPQLHQGAFEAWSFL